MAEQGWDEELDVDFFHSDKVKPLNQVDRIDFKLTVDGS